MMMYRSTPSDHNATDQLNEVIKFTLRTLTQLFEGFDKHEARTVMPASGIDKEKTESVGHGLHHISFDLVPWHIPRRFNVDASCIS